MGNASLNRAKDIAQIVSLIAVPIILALFGWLIQSTIKSQEIRRDYVQIAVQILSQKAIDEDDQEMRRWALRLLEDNSPIKFTANESKAFISGSLSLTGLTKEYVTPKLPEPAADLMVPAPTGEEIMRRATQNMEALQQKLWDGQTK